MWLRVGLLALALGSQPGFAAFELLEPDSFKPLFHDVKIDGA